jgi:hypothetical protein
MSEEQETVLSNLTRARAKGRGEILASVTFGKDKTVRVLNELIDLGPSAKKASGARPNTARRSYSQTRRAFETSSRNQRR